MSLCRVHVESNITYILSFKAAFLPQKRQARLKNAGGAELRGANKCKSTDLLSSSGQPCEVVHDQPTTGEGAGGHIDGWEELHAQQLALSQ